MKGGAIDAERAYHALAQTSRPILGGPGDGTKVGNILEGVRADTACRLA
jgi:hypothetical protein